ncbi:MAG: gas vesicle protein GvpJ [bacterium]
MSEANNYNKNAGLVDALDKLIDKGAVVQGDLIVRLADLDLLAIQLKLVLISMSRLETQQGARVGDINQAEIGDKVYLKKLENQIKKTQAHINQMINADTPRQAESGLAKLVLTLIKLIVDLVEREATRRVQAGHLTQTEIEKLGLNLQAIESKLEELRLIFGLKEKDLNLDLGPIGQLR